MSACTTADPDEAATGVEQTALSEPTAMASAVAPEDSERADGSAAPRSAERAAETATTAEPAVVATEEPAPDTASEPGQAAEVGTTEPTAPTEGGTQRATDEPASAPTAELRTDVERPTVSAEDEAPVEVEMPPGFVPGEPATHPLAIERLRAGSYPGSELVVVQELPPGSNYRRAVATYESEGLTIRGLLTIPNGERPASGWPVIIFNHGYIPPAQYRTTERYVAYQDAFARAGYITYKSDYRGHGSSQGESSSSRGSPAYTVDVLNAMASVARHPDADPNRIGMWGHSMGGLITLKSMVISDSIRAGVIWAGVVASYPDLYHRLGREDRPSRGWWNRPGRRSWRVELVELFGTPEENPAAWAAVSPNAFLGEISGPLQLHHGTADSSVPVVYSTRLQEQMEAAGRPSELFVYEGDDHNISGSLTTALARSVAFFDQHVKGGE